MKTQTNNTNINDYPLISIIIPVHNRHTDLNKSVASILAQDYPEDKMEVFIIDDGSQPPISVSSFSKSVQVIRQNKSGDTAARNLGASRARGEYLFFTDSDCICSPTAIRNLYLGIKDNRKIASARGGYLNNSPNIISRFVQMDFEYRQSFMRKSASNVDLLDSACMLIKHKAFKDVGGFPSEIQVCGDVAISYQFLSKGYKLKYIPEAKVIHKHSNTIIAYIKNKFRKGYWRSKVFQLFPKMTIKDSYTPQALKLQSCISLLLITIIPLLIFSQELIFVDITIILVLLLFISTIPFAMFINKRDKLLLLFVPFLIFIRALSVISGVLSSILHRFVLQNSNNTLKEKENKT